MGGILCGNLICKPDVFYNKKEWGGILKTVIKHNDYNLTYDDFRDIDEECFPYEYYSVLHFEDMRQSDFWVAYIYEKPVGYISIKNKSEDIHLSRIGIRKDYRNIGIASELMNTLVNFSSSINKPCISLLVETTNKYAIHLYEKYGFLPIGSKCQFIIPINKLLLEHNISNNKISAVSIDGYESKSYKHELEFINCNNDVIGKCFLNSEFPGCSYYEIVDPYANFINSLISLRMFLNLEKDILVLTIDQKSLIDTCINLGFKLNYELIKMQKSFL